MGQVLRIPLSAFAVFLAGLIAGLLLGTALEQHTLKVLPPTPWVVARKSTDAFFGRLLPWVWNTTLLSLCAAGFLNHHVARWCFLLAALMLLLGIVVTLVIEVPMNRQLAAWDPEALPANWTVTRDRWLRFHTVRTMAGIAAFGCALVALVARIS